MVSVAMIGILVALAVQLGCAPGGRRVGELGIARTAPGDAAAAGGAAAAGRAAGGDAAGSSVGAAGPGRRWAGTSVPATDSAPAAAPVPAAARVRGPVRGRRPVPGGRDLPVRVVVLQVVALLRAGAAPGAAWSAAAGVPVDLAGVPDEPGLTRLLGARSARAVVAATRLALDVGAPLVRVLESVAESLVRDAEGRAERETAIAGPRTTARVILWLPVAGAGLGWALGADPIGVATGGGAGSLAILLGVALLLAGWAWSARLVERARERPAADAADVQVVLDLLAAALGAGAGVPRALGAVGQAVGGRSGATLRRAGDALVLGAGWEQAWAGATEAFVPVTEALRGAWTDGAPPGEALRAAGQDDRNRRSAAARAAAARLGVQLVLPLGCCYLPAFVLVGLVPVLLALGLDLLGA